MVAVDHAEFLPDGRANIRGNAIRNVVLVSSYLSQLVWLPLVNLAQVGLILAICYDGD